MKNSARPGILSGLLDNVTTAAKCLVALGINRIELAAIELGELTQGVARMAIMLLVGLFALMFAVLFWSGVIVVLAWDTLGWKILLLMAGFFTLVAGGLFFSIVARVKRGGFGLPLTMEELRKDRDALM